ncbi:MAG: MFS transporter [Gammaproteobacteria bacterium]
MKGSPGPDGMSSTEIRAAFSLAGIYSLRMLGLFMILPVFALYAEHLEGFTPALAGLAIGIYGMTQALLQIPFGLLSDRLGRKRVIVAGLLLFALGSVVAALADSMWGVILGRAIQGAGAIAAAVMALTADLTREEHRVKAMAVIGMSIGVSFAVAMVAGPLLNSWIGVPGIFWLTALLALGGIAVLLWLVPQPVISRVHRDAEPIPAQFRSVLRNGELLRLDLGILVLHMILTATFVVLPLVLRDELGLAAADHWKLYLPVMLGSMLAVLPFIFLAERKRRLKPVFLAAILVLGLAEFGLYWLGDGLVALALWVFVFFAAFNLLEASLPSLVAKMAPPDSKGTAMGFYSSSQFLGAFLGGLLGGWLHARYGLQGVFLFCALAAGGWLLVALGMKNPRYLASYLLPITPCDARAAQRLAGRLTLVRGVAEAVVPTGEPVAYLKVDRHALDEVALEAFAVPPKD